MLKRKIPNMRRKRKDAKGQGRSWGAEAGEIEGQSQGV